MGMNKGRKGYTAKQVKNMNAVDKQRVLEHRERVLLKYDMIRSTLRSSW